MLACLFNPPSNASDPDECIQQLAAYIPNRHTHCTQMLVADATPAGLISAPRDAASVPRSSTLPMPTSRPASHLRVEGTAPRRRDLSQSMILTRRLVESRATPAAAALALLIKNAATHHRCWPAGERHQRSPPTLNLRRRLRQQHRGVRSDRRWPPRRCVRGAVASFRRTGMRAPAYRKSCSLLSCPAVNMRA